MKNQQRSLIYLLFAFSSAAGLIYQVAWVRQTSLIFGVSIYAYSTVLAAFMAGMALGSYFLRGFSEKYSPLRLYAWLQAGIALFGLLSPFLLQWLMPIYGSLAQNVSIGLGGLIGIRALLAIIVLILPTFLMGATLPALARAVAQRSGMVAASIGKLYAADTLGAAIGCILAALLFLRLFGTQATIWIAVLLNLVCAAVAFLLSKNFIPAAQKTTRQTAPASPSAPIAPLFLYTLSGFAALGYEIVWARILSIFTLDAVYSFAIMLTTFLIGLTVGGWCGIAWVRRKRITLFDFAVVQLSIALSALITLYIFYWMPNITLEGTFGTPTLGKTIAFEFVLGFIALILPTTLIGLLFPMVVSLVTGEEEQNVGHHTGLISALNTFGAILGSLVIGFAIIPGLGLKGTLLMLVAINSIIALIAFGASTEKRMSRWLVPAVGFSLAILLAFLAPPGYYLGFRSDPGEHMIYYGEGAETTVAVFEVPEQNFKVSFVNGRIEVPTDEVSMNAFRLLGHLGPILHPNAQRALMLSFGNGIASGSLDTHAVPWIDAVDLSAQQFEAADKYFVENHNILHSAALQKHIEDGRNFLLQTSMKYDIITTDATHPSNASSWALFTLEFYQSVADHLESEGVFIQWMPFHSLYESDFKKILRTFQTVFPHVTLWYAGGSHTILVATPDVLNQSTVTSLLQQVSDNQFVADELGPPQQIERYWLMDEEQLRSYAGTGDLSHDDNAFFLPDNVETTQIMNVLQRYTHAPK